MNTVELFIKEHGRQPKAQINNASNVSEVDQWVGQLVKERNELSAVVERLRKGLEDALCLEAESAGPDNDLHPELHDAVDALNETPAQSLAAVRAEAVESAAKACMPGPCSPPDDLPEGYHEYCEGVASVLDYAQRVRNGEA